MNKQEFLEQLRKKLHVLNDEELEALIQEYDETIRDAMADGKSEEEAVASFGDIDELVKELLDAYKLRQPQKNKNVDFAQEGKKAVEKLGKMSLLSLTEWLVVAFALIVCFLLMHLCIALVNGIFTILLSFFSGNQFLYWTKNFIFYGIEIFADVLLAIKIIRGRMAGLSMQEVFDLAYLFDLDPASYETIKPFTERFQKRQPKRKEENETVIDAEVSETSLVVAETISDEHEPHEKTKSSHKKSRKHREPKEPKKHSVLSGLWAIIVFVFKFTIFCIVAPFILGLALTLILAIFGSAFALAMTCFGYPFGGITLLGIGFSVSVISFFVLIYLFFTHRSILISGGVLVAGLFIGGIGGAWTFVEFTQMEVVEFTVETTINDTAVEFNEDGFAYIYGNNIHVIDRYVPEVTVPTLSTSVSDYAQCQVDEFEKGSYLSSCSYGDYNEWTQFQKALETLKEGKLYSYRYSYQPAELLLPMNGEYEAYSTYDKQREKRVLIVGKRDKIEALIREEQMADEE